jgi:hypothetical protein
MLKAKSICPLVLKKTLKREVIEAIVLTFDGNDEKNKGGIRQ